MEPLPVDGHQHVFLSYREASDAKLAADLHKTMKDAKQQLGWAADSEVRVFWDASSLPHGHKWKAGFIQGLLSSMVFVPIISSYNDSTGSLSLLRRLGVISEVDGKAFDSLDGLLLEWELALGLAEAGRLTICPVLCGGQQGAIGDFQFLLHELSAHPSDKTKKELRKMCELIEMPFTDAMRDRSVRDVIRAMLRHEGVILSRHGQQTVSKLPVVLSSAEEYEHAVRSAAAHVLKVAGCVREQRLKEFALCEYALQGQGSWASAEGINQQFLFLPAPGRDMFTSMSALTIAAACGHTETVSALLRIEGININLRTMDRGLTALMAAIESGHTDTALAILACGPNLKVKDNSKSTALMRASAHGNAAVVRALLAGHGDEELLLDHKDETGKTALQVAQSKGHTEVTAMLAKRGSLMASIRSLMRAAMQPGIHQVIFVLLIAVLLLFTQKPDMQSAPERAAAHPITR